MFRLGYDGTSPRARPQAPSLVPQRVWDAVIAAVVFYALWSLGHFIRAEVGWGEVGRVLVLGCYTMFRVILLLALAALVWVPIGVWIGMNPRWAGRLQGVAQFMPDPTEASPPKRGGPGAGKIVGGDRYQLGSEAEGGSLGPGDRGQARLRIWCSDVA